MTKDKKISERPTVEMDEVTHRRVIDEVTERYADPLAIMSILQAIRADQLSASQDRKNQYRHVADSLAEQNTSVNRLSTDVAGLSVRTATIEVEQQKHSALLGQVKERQDGCAARITHDNDTTEIRDLRSQLQNAVHRRFTPPHGIKLPTRPPAPAPTPSDAHANWWTSNAGKALLTALAGLLVAIASILTPWASLAPSAATEAARRPPTVRPVRSVPAPDRPIADSDLDDMIDTVRARRGAVEP